MAKHKEIPKDRKFWLGELKRAKLEKPNYIERVIKENFSAVDPLDADAVLSAREFAEGQFAHFIKSFKRWINDNYPAQSNEQDLFAELKTVNEALQRNFPGMTMHVVGVDPGTIHF